ncbi:TPA: RNA polymerase sigma factor [Staphylococcus aureus]|nr:RNA polymerase sigma factor [Staphylococcus aureus]
MKYDLTTQDSTIKRNNAINDKDFEKLVMDLQPLIIRRIKTFGFNHYDLEDLYQEILIRMYRSVQTFDFSGEQPFTNYVQCLITSVKYDYLNKLAIKELICQFKYLSAFEKDVMYLMCEQYKPREIAQLMHVKEKVIYNAIQRCKNKIKRYFKMI